MLEEEPLGGQVIQEFGQDLDAYETVMEKNDFPEVGKVLDRSVFNKATVWQLVEILKASEWQASEGFLAFVRRRFKRLMTSQVIEDGINRAKNARRMASGPKYAPPERAMTIVAVRNVLGSVHLYEETDGTKHLAPATTSLPPNTWRANAKDADQVLKDIVGTRSPDWYSPGAAGLAIEFADLVLIKEAVERVLFSWKHDIVLRKVRADRGWLLPLGPVKESAALVVRLEASPVPGHPQTTIFKVKDGALVLVPVLRHEGWEACEVRWPSPVRAQCGCNRNSLRRLGRSGRW